MISVYEAERLILDNWMTLQIEKRTLEELDGRVLAQDILATRNQPSFDRVCMDGIAIPYKSLRVGRNFKLEAVQKAGEKPLVLSNQDHCIEVMTGASLPEGTDTIIPYEKVDIKNGFATVKLDADVKPRQNIHFKAHDYGEGNLLLPRGTKLSSVKVSLIASQGLAEVDVYKMPKVAVVSTGDELIWPGQEIENWQVYSSNSYGVKSELCSFGITDVDLFHLADERDSIFEKLKIFISNYDIVLLSGGVSKGKYDFVKDVLCDLKVNILFHKISQKPGKPMLFAKSEEGKLIVGLPGNPNAALICLRKFHCVVFGHINEIFSKHKIKDHQWLYIGPY